ncbi:peptidase family U48 [Achlya hypogyna]|uniref:intramembrane prenyl-peptidase Rce1 n=1 Tax=Achlya hypogyna TaxID=1202772 RepID=A0A1V9ZIC5_ACHHY|nr:peptidase family U48 [Achlya hypogyna]
MKFAVSPAEAVLSCLAMAAAYVGVLYCAPTHVRALPRDHPTQILTRFFLISFVCVLSPIYMMTFYQQSANGMSLLAWLGLHRDILSTVVATGLCLLLTVVLFAGSLFASALELQKEATAMSWLEALKATQLYASFRHEHLKAIRTYIYVIHDKRISQIKQAPLTEEFVFRGCMAALLLNAGFSVSHIVFLSPLAFGVAHAHHFYEHVRGGMPWMRALAIVVFQLVYTTVFGIYATFLFLRTGQLVAIIVVHAFCNVMGFPDLSFVSPDSDLYTYRHSILGVYLVGIVCFSVLLYPVTAPTLHAYGFWAFP